MGPASEREPLETTRFEVVRRLGAGAAGVVYEARDRETGARVALKTIARFDPNAVYDLKREFRSLADVTHPNLVRLYELFVEEGRCFFTMEVVDGGGLLDHGRADGAPSQVSGVRHAERGDVEGAQRLPWPADDRASLRRALVQLAQALVHLHAHGKLHRDVKPSNVLLTRRGRVVLLDFGILSDLRDPRGAEGDAGIVGTPAYMAPEQARGDAVGPAADWYAVGCVLFEALTGRLPFEGTGLDMLSAKQEREPPAPGALVAGVPPDLDELCVALLRSDPAARPSGPEVVERLRGPNVASSRRHGATLSVPPGEVDEGGRGRLIGRNDDAAALERAFARARAGASTVATVEGVSGMGKSAFVRAFLAERETAGDAIVLAGRCFERESVPYKALDEVVDALSRHLIELPTEEQRYVVQRDAAALARLFPVLARVPAVADAPRRAGEGFDGQQLRRRAFAALRDAFARLAEQQPVVVFIDDLQWSDVDGVALLREIVAPPEAPPILAVLAFRSEDRATSAPLRGLLEFLAGVGAVGASVVLGPLTPHEAEEVAAKTLAAAGLSDPALAAQVARESGGSPFFVGELARLLVASRGRLHDVRLETVVRDRVADLPDDARRLLQIVAVAARPLRKAAALRAADLRGEAGLEALLHLQTRSLVRTRVESGGDALECFHDRIREATCAGVDAASLAQLHARIAQTLTEEGTADPEVLLTHFAASGDRARAAELAVAAARRTAQALAFDRAAQLFRSALDLLPPTDERVHALQVELGDALTNAGRGGDAAEAYFTAAASTPAAAESIFLKRRAAEELLYAGVVDRGRETLAYVLSLYGMRFAQARWRAIVGVLFLRAWLTLRGLSYRAREPSAIAPSELMRLDLLVSAATCLVMIDTVIGAPFATGNVVAALGVGEPWRICRALVVETCFLCTAGEPVRARADRYLARAREAARAVARADTDALVTATQGVAHYFRGEWRAASELLGRGLTAYEDFIQPMAGARTMTGYNFSARWEMSTFRYFKLVSLTHLGRLDELAQCLAAFARDAEDRGDLAASTNYRVGESNFHWLARGEPDTVTAIVDEAMARWPERAFLRQHWLALLARTQVDLYRGATPATLRRVEGAWGPLRRSLLRRIQYFDLRALHLRARATLACLGEEKGLRRERLARSEGDARAILGRRAPWAAPFGQLVLAAVAHQRGDAQRAHAAIDLAIAGFDAGDMPLWAHAARHRSGALLGGDAGSARRREAEEALARAGVREPARMIAMMAPGFERES